MKKVILLSCLSSMLVMSCEPKKPDVVSTPTPEKPATDKAPESIPVVDDVKPVDKAVGEKADVAEKKFVKADLPSEAKVKGKISGGLAWTDTNGENFVVFSRTADKTLKTKSGESVLNKDGTETPFYKTEAWLFANHFVKNKAGVKNVREIKQLAPCEEGADLYAEFQPKTNSVTDLDKDGFGEATFAYQLTCATDMSPKEYKLFVIENGDKHVLRGHSRFEDMGGKFKADPSFKGHDEFLKHATVAWEKAKETYD